MHRRRTVRLCHNAAARLIGLLFVYHERLPRSGRAVEMPMHIDQSLSHDAIRSHAVGQLYNALINHHDLCSGYIPVGVVAATRRSLDKLKACEAAKDEIAILEDVSLCLERLRQASRCKSGGALQTAHKERCRLHRLTNRWLGTARIASPV